MHNFSSFLSFYTLLKKEVLRFLAVSVQTIITPIITASLYLLVFGASIGSQLSVMNGVPYIQFIVPGLIIMGVMNNSFANSSSSLFFSRYLGNIVDLLVTPITPAQFIFAYTLAAMLRGICVGASVFFISLFFTSMPWANPVAALGFLLLASFLFAQFGLIAALYSNSFDQLSMYTNFLILPLIYMGGLFYPISQLPALWGKISHFNPLFYLIDGFRHAILGVGDNPLWLNFSVPAILAVILFGWCALLFKSGRRLRA